MPISAENYLRVLLVEDSDDDAYFFQRALDASQLRCVLRRVRHGVEAIHYLEGKPPFSDRSNSPFPDILITDLKMPMSDGFDLLNYLHNQPSCSVIPSIVLSSSYQQADVVKAYQLGANAFIAKPQIYTDLSQILIAIHMFWSLCERPSPPPDHKC